MKTPESSVPLSEAGYLDLLASFYRIHYYTGALHESPEFARQQMGELVGQEIVRQHEQMGQEITVLDMASGPGSVFIDVCKMHPEVIPYTRFITNDISRFEADQMFTALFPQRQINHIHINNSALEINLPYDDNANIVISNFGIDLLPRRVFRQVRLNMKPDGVGLFHFHHPDLLKFRRENPQAISEYSRQIVTRIDQYLEEQRLIFPNLSSIIEGMYPYSLMVVESAFREDPFEGEKWWFAKMKSERQ